MPRDPNPTRTLNNHPPTGSFDAALDAGLAAAFGVDATPGGWSQPPLLRDDPSEHAPLVQPSSAEMPRGAIVRYQLLGEIARGGMGVVLKGRDPDLGRDLAFKVLRQELSGKPAALQRFVEEAQVGGQLQHPGIVPVYDIGRFADGRPYFAMKLVKGRTLADLLAERTDPATGRGQYLQHFRQVCQTLAFAHSKGVIHRDLKPSNVMVGAFDEVLVMDWGLAKVLPRGGVADEAKASRASEPADVMTEIKTARFGSGSETEAGSVLGTPAFMPPEQAGGEIDKLDERADVFGLGAVLCVILTGKPPYVSDSSDAVRLMAVRGQLDDCFARLDACGADAELVALCKRSLSVNRESRPRDAGELATALKGYLAGVETRAHDAELERERAEVRHAEERKRRKVQLALVAMTAFLVLGGGVFGWWQDRQNSSRREEQANRERDEQERQRRNGVAVLALVERCETALRGDDSVVAAAALGEIDGRSAEGGVEDHRDRIEQCRADLALLADLNRVDNLRWASVDGDYIPVSDVASAWSEALSRYGIVPGKTLPADVARRVTLSLVKERFLGSFELRLVSAPSPELVEILNLADADEFRNAVRVAFFEKKWELYRELAQRPTALDQPARFIVAITVGNTLPGNRRRALLERAWTRRPGDLQLLLALGQSYPGGSGLSPEASAEKLRWFQAAASTHRENPAAWICLGLTLRDRGDLVGAAEAFREVIRLQPNDYWGHGNLGVVLKSQGKFEEALSEYQKTIAIKPLMAKFRWELGYILLALDDQGGAVEACREAVRLEPMNYWAHHHLGYVQRVAGEEEESLGSFRESARLNPNHALTHENIGYALYRKGDLDGALVSYREAKRLAPNASGINTRLRSLFWDKAKMLESQKDRDGANALYLEAIQLDPKFSVAHLNFGLFLARIGETDRAIVEYREALRINSKNPRTHDALGHALHAKKEYPGAIAAWREAILLDPKSSNLQNSLGLALHYNKDYDEAITTFKEAIRLAPESFEAHRNLGNTYLNNKDYKGAIGAYRDSIQINPNNPKHAGTHNNLGIALLRLKEFDGAITAYRDSIRLDPKHTFAHGNLGSILLLNKKDYTGALDALQAALRLDPTNAQYLANIGHALSKLGRPEEAIAKHREAIALEPRYLSALNGLAWIFATTPNAALRDGPKAVELATRACELNGWRSASGIDTLAAAYAEVGNFEKAIEYQKKAMAIPDLDKDLEEEMRKRLELYSRKEPYREVVRALAPPPREVKP